MATLPGSSIVKRDAKLLESKRSVIPDDAGAETSFRDQLQGLDGLGLRLLLYENPPEPKPKPKVLLSHNVTMATLPGSNVAKRGEDHLESQLPTIPYGTGGQTSCRDQLESTTGPGLCLPLQENRPEPKHKIFLSHSGAQKSFVKQLCKDIERYDRYPFFDLLRTSLSIGCHFPNAIFEAIDQCQVAVVVLSEDFFSRTKWPMLELSALVKRQGHDPSLIIMPVFLGLTREQCLEKENHDRWLSLWGSWAMEDRRIILYDWLVVFKVFGCINSVSLCGLDEVKCREDIVDAICKEVPPETQRDDSHVQGRTRMCKTIGEKLGSMELSKCYKVRVLGLYGVGGIGKSTACMTLCNHYFEEFHGRVCHVEFGVGDELHMLREILKRLTDIKHEQIEGLNFDECKHKMKNIKNQKILLAVDNVFDSYEVVEQAKLILRVGFAKNSIVVVTARSLGELKNLDIVESECMEMPELTMNDAISVFVKEVSCVASTSEHLIQQCVDQCYFSKGDGLSFHYHPLALRVLGGQLGSDSSEWLEKLEEIDVFNQYRENAHKHPIFSILRRSFDILNDEDKLLFMDCAIFATQFQYPLKTCDDQFEWLSMIHGKRTKSRLNGLRRKSVIYTLEEGTTVIGIHDLWREFCVMEINVGELKSRQWIYARFSGSNDPFIEESNIFSGAWKSARRVSLTGPFQGIWNVHMILGGCSCLAALHLEIVELEGNALDLNVVFNLKSLIIVTQSSWEVRGLGSLRQLCLLEWSGEMPSNETFFEEIGGLSNLQILNLSHSGVSMKIGFPNLSNLSLLQRVALCNLEEGVSLSFNTSMTNLCQLHLKKCQSLQRCNGLSDLVKLEVLEIHSCPDLEELPDLHMLKNLKKLSISECSLIQILLGVGDLVTLLELEACNFVELPNLSKLTNLQVLKLRECLVLPNLSKLTNLQVLKLEECSLDRVAMELSELINLRECRISFEAIGEFNDLHKLTKLESIYVEGWNLEGSSSVDSLVNLKDLRIEDCQGVDSLSGLSKVSGLCKLTLWDCAFKDVACLKDLLGLRYISIHGCNLLESFPDMRKARRLKSVQIRNCKNLRVWEGFNSAKATSPKAIRLDLQSDGAFPNLEYLILYNLAITELPDLSNFPHLNTLSILCCKSLVQLKSIVPLTSLISFDASYCKSLTTIPNFSGCKHLQRISVQDSGVKLSENEMEYLRVLCPTINIDIF